MVSLFTLSWRVALYAWPGTYLGSLLIDLTVAASLMQAVVHWLSQVSLHKRIMVVCEYYVCSVRAVGYAVVYWWWVCRLEKVLASGSSAVASTFRTRLVGRTGCHAWYGPAEQWICQQTAVWPGTNSISVFCLHVSESVFIYNYVVSIFLHLPSFNHFNTRHTDFDFYIMAVLIIVSLD